MNTNFKLMLFINVLIALGNQSFAQTIPDEVDYKKYYSIYQKFKQISDDKRLKADQAQSAASATEQELQSVIGQIRQNSSTLSQHQTDLAQFNRDIQTLQSQNDSMTATINDNQSQMNRNNGAIQNLQGQIDQNQTFTQRALNDKNQAENFYNQTLRNSQALENRLKSAEQERDSSLSQANLLEQTLRNKQTALNQSQTSIASLDQERATLEQAIPPLQQQAQVLQQQLAGLQTQTQQAATELATLRNQKLTLQNQNGQDKVARDAAQAQLTKIDQAIQTLVNQINSLQASIDQNKKAIAAKQAEIDFANLKIGMNAKQIQMLTTQAMGLSKRSQGLRLSIEPKTNEKADAEKELRSTSLTYSLLLRKDPNNPELGKLKARIDELNKKIADLIAELADLNKQLTELTNQLTATNKQIATLNAENDRLKALVANGPAQIAALQAQANASQAQLTTANSQKAEQDRLRGTTVNQLQAAEAKFQTSTTGLQNLNQQYTLKEAQYKAAADKEQAVRTQYDRAQSAYTQKQARLNQVKSDLATARTSVTQLTQEIATLRQQSANARNVATQKEQAYQAILAQAQQARTDLNTAQRQLQQITLALVKLQDQRHDLDLALQQLSNQNGTLLANNQNLQAQIKDNRATIKYKQEMIVWTNQEDQRLSLENSDLNQQQNALTDQLSKDQAIFAQLNQSAALAENDTAVKFQAYDSRKKLYDTSLADAVSKGTAAGSEQGQNDGSPKGQQAGLSQGAHDGQIKGMNEGLEYGFKAGKVDGDAKGYADGHTKGASSDAEYTRGVTNGVELGKNDATAEALRVDYVKGKQDQFAKLTSGMPSQQIQIDQSPLSSGANSSNPLGLKSLKSSVMQFVKLEKATAVCVQTFVDFKKACDAAYKTAYDESYQMAYQDAYDQAFSSAFEDARKTAFNQYKGTRYQEGYQVAYTPAFDRGAKVGEQESYQRGVVAGRKSGYDQSIQAARASAYAKGVADMNQYFATHAVLILKDAKLTRVGIDGSVGGSISASDLLKLELTVANYGAKESSAQNVKVELKAMTSLVSVSQVVTQLVSIPANSVTQVSNVLTAKISETATTGSVERLKMIFTDAEGVSAERDLSVQVQPNLQVSIQRVDYSTSPKVGKTQKMKVFLKNAGNIQPTEKITLGITTNAPKDQLMLNQAEVEVYELPVGSTFSIPGLTYTVMNADALSRGITMTLYLKHGTRVVAKQDLLLKR